MYYSVLIIDDEFYICDSLKTKLQNLNFPEIRDIRTCYSGEEALELCETFRPSIVITDIKMDGMDGIHLIHELKKKLHPVRFLVLSGYDNYEYVRNSFQEGAADYLLKPILSEDLRRIVAEQLQWLKNERNTVPDSRSSSILLAEQFFQKLRHPLTTENLDSLIKNFPFAFCRLIILAWKPKKTFSGSAFLDNIYKHYSSFSDLLVFACSVSQEKICILQNTESKENFSLSFWEDLMKSCQQGYFPDPAVGISTWNSPKNLPSLYYEAENQLARRLLEGYQKIYQGSAPPAAKELPARLRQLTLQILSKPELLSGGDLWTKLTDQLRSLSLSELKRYYNFFSGTYLSYVANYRESEVPIDFQSFYEFYSYEQLERYIARKISACVPYTLNSSKTNIELIKEYIDEHFTEALSMSEVANRFFISYSHLSKLFHGKVGMSFQEYLISKRMTYASQLLHDPRLSIQEIAFAVGYDNVFNFSRAFKKYFGVAPNYYREL